jgi:hypothetical protein
MDTYASAAGDPGGFYNIAALAPAVDAFFVMQYELNLASPASAQSPLTSTMFSDQTTIDQYTAVVPASKVILGMPFFGIDWPTTDNTLTAQATGPAATMTYAQIVAGGHPVYWDATTDTAWTAYQVGTQWHETFFEDPTSLYDAAQLAGAAHLAGVGIWALGMEGDALDMEGALLGFAPAVKDGLAGPTTTTSTTTTSTTAAAGAGPTTTTSSSTTTTTTTTAPGSTTTTSTTPAGGNAFYGGTWQGTTVTLTPVSGSSVPALDTGPAAGQLTGFTTSDPALTCLSQQPSLNVWGVSGTPDAYVAVAATPTDCADADFTFTSVATP